MAFSQFVTGSVTKLPTRIYNSDYAVGRTGVNNRADVMLLQALFRIFYYEMMGFNEGFDPPPGENDVIVVDGWMGPITQRHIDHFQSQMIESGADLARDGRVDPYREPGQRSTIQHKVYTMYKLNAQCQQAGFKNKSPAYSALGERPDMPIELRNALKMVKQTANQYR